jgi:hypothetical protein
LIGKARPVADERKGAPMFAVRTINERRVGDQDTPQNDPRIQLSCSEKWTANAIKISEGIFFVKKKFENFT